MRVQGLRRARRWYGEGTLHLLLMLSSFALAGYAGVRLLDGDRLAIVIWFAGAALVHDLVLVPLYSLADRGLRAGAGRWPGAAAGRRADVNFVRVPAFLSGLLLLVWFPLITGQVENYTPYTGLPADVFLPRWLLITAGLFAVSAVWLTVELLRLRRRATKARPSADH
ncbi:hypothetical protein M1E25_14055 [Streptomyces sp. MTZ3.1]|uniref:Lipoprotein n=1 Tax=Streptomyces meridianus TaxID=2938945 RepID=A0ABT0X7G5_9ACTN|nr:hypothetical protein [Streptomyces meridianus]